MTDVHFLRVPAGHIGYGRMGMKLEKALLDAGVSLDVTLDSDATEIANVASWAAIPAHATGWFDGQYKSILTMWEATRLPESFRENLDAFDLVMVPSAQNVEIFSKFHPNVKQVNLGIDPQDWAYRPRLPHDKEFRFLVGGSGPRKGTDLVVRAFRKLWGNPGSWRGPTPVLLIKSPTGKVLDSGENQLPLMSERMRLIPGHLTEEEERDLYGYAHVYVQPSRGEGFGLQPLQAIAQGCPTILTDAHGHASFAYLGYPIEATQVEAAYFSHGYAGDWWEPDFGQLCEHMKFVYENYNQAQNFAISGSIVAHWEFTWADTAKGWVDAHDGQIGKPYSGTRTWEKPVQKLFRATLARRFSGNVGGTQYDIPAARDTWVTADLKRILFDGHYLHPDCLDDHAGLTESQLSRMDEHLARDGHCAHCGQALNSGPTLADGIYEQMLREVSDTTR